MEYLKKRGASPLIATIVLIAFAVSLGGFIMSLGGFYYEKIRAGDCIQVAISGLSAKDSLQCGNAVQGPIINFYTTDKSYEVPACYNETLSGKGKVCGPSAELLKNSWVPSGNAVK